MTIAQLSNTTRSTSQGPQLNIKNFTIEEGQHWTIIGGNGSGKSTFARMLQSANPEIHTAIVSFEDEQSLLEREIYEDDSEWLNKVDNGRTSRELIEETIASNVVMEHIIDTLQLEQCIDTGFRLLSTGERRRLMLARALAASPALLILDEPYDGLDVEFTAHLKELIAHIASDIPTVLITNRLSDINNVTSHIAYLDQMEMVFQGTYQEAKENQLFQHLTALNVPSPTLPAALPNTNQYSPQDEQAIVELQNIHVAYHNKTVLNALNWTITPKQHWKVSGPNGCGKSTLVNLISGDHPQCYSNTIYLFGKKRGLGESIWDIKHYMGLMSSTLHQQYRITATAETVILSGFFDTIGVYRPVSAVHKKIANEWLEFVRLDSHKNTHFHQLSYGQQRMLLIARALIKRPYLLILDEPCQGLDPINRTLVLKLIEHIITANMAQLIYISHENEDTLRGLTHELKFIPTTDSQYPSGFFTEQHTL